VLHDVYRLRVLREEGRSLQRVAPGALVLFEGRRKRVKQGECWETMVSCFDLMAVASG
jgi:hypothetical protein